MKYSAVLFDLDGTLLYTLEDIADALNRTLCAHGMKELALDMVRAYVGNGSRRLVERAVPSGSTEETVEGVLRDYRADYDINCNVKTKPYDGITELLEALSARGFKLAVVSNKPDGAVKALAQAHFPGVFSIAVGEGSNVRRKPWPDSVLAAMEKMGVQKEEALYVGDSEVDVQTASNAGVRCVSACWGFRTKEELAEAGATLMIDRPLELLNHI